VFAAKTCIIVKVFAAKTCIIVKVFAAKIHKLIFLTMSTANEQNTATW